MEDDASGPIHSRDPMLSSPHLPPLSPAPTGCQHGLPDEDTLAGGIKVEMKVPNEAKIGSSIELECVWQIHGPSGLYSVKWYKDDHEFFRYVPDNDPRIQTFSQPGINVDNRWNTENSIRLKELETKSSGQYKCEVSTEAPSFATVYRTANLTVIAMPERGPEITGLSPRYTIGDDLTANCTVWPSVPTAAIRWLINEKPIAAKQTIQYSTMEIRKKKEREQRNEETSTSATTPNALGLRVKLEPLHFEGVREKSVIAIKCVARVGSYLLATEKRVSMNYANKQRLSADNARSEAHGWHRVRPTERFSLLLICYFCSRLRTNDRMVEQNEQN
nr:PREDICTED: uncharacterized protein LOC105661969 isoform X1 [Megachile rotundata]